MAAALPALRPACAVRRGRLASASDANPPKNALTDCEQQPRIVREALCLRVIGAAEEDDRAEVVRREVLLEEAAHESARAQDLLAGDLVKGDDIQTSLALIVGLDIRLDGLAANSGRSGSRARNVDERRTT